LVESPEARGRSGDLRFASRRYGLRSKAKRTRRFGPIPDRPSGRNAVRVVALAFLAAAAIACSPGFGTAEEAIFEFLNAVQSRDTDALYCRLAGAAVPEGEASAPSSNRTEFDAWVESRFAAYLVDRDDGWVELGDDGITLALAFALGRGTYYTLRSVEPAEDGTILAEMEVRFAYGEIDVSGFPPGTVFYVCGKPVGVIHAVRVPFGRDEIPLEVLETVVVRWTLVREAATDSCPERWTIASVVPREGTAETKRVTWVF
jgi:hypothetical protein